MGGVKTASELAVEYWDKPPIERINNTVQDYVYDYQQKRINELRKSMRMALISVQDGEVDRAEKILRRKLRGD